MKELEDKYPKGRARVPALCLGAKGLVPRLEAVMNVVERYNFLGAGVSSYNGNR